MKVQASKMEAVYRLFKKTVPETSKSKFRASIGGTGEYIESQDSFHQVMIQNEILRVHNQMLIVDEPQIMEVVEVTDSFDNSNPNRNYQT
ncbi:UNKNOWN [Stylonychia lemnae]|uniref:Uncharacterized protein n=1 Tax=Stylonychia lemnae TaxID=5949 RepID=A0A078AW99_STYLE|nr:UNKNOWN [Stylonychia lemnae]|eukprot:CDW86414.1 UNKNOWN [Stylonychia lemnae]